MTIAKQHSLEFIHVQTQSIISIFVYRARFPWRYNLWISRCL
ncbi:MAG: hypothetical protein WCK47_08125 [bacterium]|nr:hypothetical protein [Candidatus Sumerlaeota bacterium]